MHSQHEGLYAFNDGCLRLRHVQGKTALRQLFSLMATGQNAAVPDALKARRQGVLQETFDEGFCR